MFEKNCSGDSMPWSGGDGGVTAFSGFPAFRALPDANSFGERNSDAAGPADFPRFSATWRFSDDLRLSDIGASSPNRKIIDVPRLDYTAGVDESYITFEGV
jgi:hypothetical protein